MISLYKNSYTQKCFTFVVYMLALTIVCSPAVAFARSSNGAPVPGMHQAGVPSVGGNHGGGALIIPLPGLHGDVRANSGAKKQYRSPGASRPLGEGVIVPVPGFYLSASNLPKLANPNELPILQEVVTGLSESDITIDGNRLIVNQQEDKAIITWGTFNVGENGEVEFDQRVDQVVLNRIKDLNPSKIYGQLKASGTIYLVNQNGVVFGPNSRTVVGKGLVVSSLDIRDDIFLNNQNLFSAGQINSLDPDGALVIEGVSNFGTITAGAEDGNGFVVFLGPLIENEGKIDCPAGRIHLIAGSGARFSGDFSELESRIPSDEATRAELQTEDGDNTVINNGELDTSSEDAGQAGHVNIWATVVNHNGLIKAVSTTTEGGSIKIRADKSITTGDDSQTIIETVNPGNRPFDPADLDGDLGEINFIAALEQELGGLISAPSGDINITEGRLVVVDEVSGEVDIIDEIDDIDPTGELGLTIRGTEGDDAPGQGIGIRKSAAITAAGGGFGSGGNINVTAWDGNIVVEEGALLNVDGTDWGEQPVEVFNTDVLDDVQIDALSGDAAFRGLDRDGLQLTLDAGAVRLIAPKGGTDLRTASISGEQKSATARSWDIPFSGEDAEATFGGIEWNLEGTDDLLGIGGTFAFETNDFGVPISPSVVATSISVDEMLARVAAGGFSTNLRFKVNEADGPLTIGSDTLIEAQDFSFDTNGILNVDGTILSNNIDLRGDELYFNGIIQAFRGHFNAASINLTGDRKLVTSEDSIIAILISDDATPQDASFLPQQGQINLTSDFTEEEMKEVDGEKYIEIEHKGIVELNGRILAPGLGSENNSDILTGNTGVNITAGDRIFLSGTSVIDVSGNRLTKSFEDNQVTVQLNSNELRDDLAQRNGILRGNTVVTHELFGSSIGDLSSALGTEQLTALEQSTEGGVVRLGTNAGVDTTEVDDVTIIERAVTDDVIIRDGAVVDFSGGGVEYENGVFEETQLIVGNKVVGISEADTTTRYDMVVGPGNEQQVSFDRFGVTEEYGLLLGGSQPIFNKVDSYFEGDDAGGLIVLSRAVSLNGDIQGGVETGVFQTQVADVLGVSGVRMPAPGVISIGEADVGTGQDNNLLLGEIIVSGSRRLLGDGFGSDPAVDPWPDDLVRRLSEDDSYFRSIIGADVINESGIGSLRLFANAKITVEEDAELNLAPGGFQEGWVRSLGSSQVPVGYVQLVSGAIDHQGVINALSGTVELRLAENIRNRSQALIGAENRLVQTSGFPTHIYLAEDSVINVAGEQIFETAGSAQGDFKTAARVFGGRVLIDTTELSFGDADVGGNQAGLLAMHKDAVINVDGGWLVDGSGDVVSAGGAGSFELETNAAVLDGTITGRSLLGQDGGTFSVDTDFLLVQKADAPQLPDEYSFGGDVPEEHLVLTSQAIQKSIEMPFNEEDRASFSGYIYSQDRLSGSGFSKINLVSSTVVYLEDNLNLTPSYTKLAQPSLFNTSEVVSPVLNNVGVAVGAESVNPDGTINALPEFAGTTGFSISSSIVENDIQDGDLIESAVSHFGEGTVIQVAPKGTISLTASGGLLSQAEFQGSLIANGGDIVLSSANELIIGANSFFDASGVLIPARITSPNQFNPGPDVIDGGSVAIGGTTQYGENVVVDVSGTPAATRFFLDIDNTIQSFETAGAAGSVSVGALKQPSNPDMEAMDATFLAQTFLPNVQGGAFRRSISGATSELLLTNEVFNELLDAGFDDLSFRGDTIVFNSDVDITVPRRLTLDFRELSGAGDDINVSLSAPWMRLMGSDDFYPNADFIVDNPELSSADTIRISGEWLDLEGIMAVSGFNQVELVSGTDIRFTDIIPPAAAAQENIKRGQFVVAGDLTMIADRIYPTTSSLFTVRTVKEDGKISVLPNGLNSEDPVYSAGGQLTLEGHEILVEGTIAAPIGQITLDGGDEGSVVLADGGVLTTKGETPTRFGISLDDVFWTFRPIGADESIQAPEVILEDVPEKVVTLEGESVATEEGSLIDVSGGGSIFISQFLDSPEGSQNPLTKPGVYVVLPGDRFNLPGEAVTIAGNDLLPAGTYTLLPPEYAFLDDALVLIDLAASGESFVPGQELSELGYSITTGFHTIKGSDISSEEPLGFAIRPAAAVLEEGFFNFAAAKAEQGGIVDYGGNANVIGGAFIASAGQNFDRSILFGNDATLTASADFKLSGRVVTTAQDIPQWYLDYLSLFDNFATNNIESAQAYLQNVLKTQEDLSADERALLSEAINTAEATTVSPLSAQQDFLASNLEYSEVLTQDEFESISAFLAEDNAVKAVEGGTFELGGNIVTFADEERIEALSGQDSLMRTLVNVESLNGAGLQRLLVDTGTGGTAERIIEVLSDTTLSLNEIVFISGGHVSIEDGAQLIASDSLDIIVPDDKLSVGQAALLQAGRKMNLDMGEFESSGELDVLNGQINVLASGGDGTLFYVADGLKQDFAGQGLVLTESNWSGKHEALSLTASELVFAGNTRLDAADSLVLNISSYDSGLAGTQASVSAETISILNTRAAGDEFETVGQGSLAFSAGTILAGRGAVRFDGFDSLTFGARKDIVLQGIGSLRSQGDMRFEGRVSTQAYQDDLIDYQVTDFLIETPGRLTFVGSTEESTLASNLGGRFRASADTIALENGASLDVPAGIVDLEAENGISVAQGARINVAGEVVKRVILDNTIVEAASGGSVSLGAVNNSVVLSEGAEINVGHNANAEDLAELIEEEIAELNRVGALDAGSAAFISRNGDVVLQGTLSGNAEFGKGGSLDVTSRTNNIDALVDRFEAGGFERSFNVRSREGDVVLSRSLVADNVGITADQGSLTINGLIDTSAVLGGSIVLNAGGDLILNSVLRAASGTDEKSRMFFHSANGWIRFNESARIEALGGGDVTFRAQRVGGDDIAIEPGGEITGSPNVVAEAFRVYEDDEVTAQDTAVWEEETFQFMEAALDPNNPDNFQSRLSASLGSSVTLIPGVEVRNAQDMVVQSGINLNTWRSERGTLTLRSPGDLVINSIIEDKPIGTAGEVELLKLYNSAPGVDTWNLNFISGGDLDSSNIFALRSVIELDNAGTGDFLINEDAYIYTESGDIRFAVGRDMRTEDPSTNVPTIITNSMQASMATYDGDIVGRVANDMILASAVQSFVGDISLQVGNDLFMDFENGNPAVRTTGKQGEFFLSDVEALDFQFSIGPGQTIRINSRITELRNDDLSDAEILTQLLGSPDDGLDGEISTIDESQFYWRYVDGGSIALTTGGSVRVGRKDVNQSGAVIITESPLINADQSLAGGGDISQWDAGYGQANAEDNAVWSANYGSEPSSGSPTLVSGENTPTGGIATMGGGDIDVHTGGFFFGQAGAFGEGDVIVESGQDLDGRFLLADGEGTIKALGNIGKGFERSGLLRGALNPLQEDQAIELFDARVNVTAFGVIRVGSVVNPTMARPGFRESASATDADLLYSYNDGDNEDSAVVFQALGGDFEIAGNTGFYVGSGATNPAEALLPPQFIVDAAGDIILKNSGFSLITAPSFTGEMKLRSAGNIISDVGGDSNTSRSSIRFLATDPAKYYFSEVGESADPNAIFEIGLERRAVEPLEEFIPDLAPGETDIDKIYQVIVEAGGDIDSLDFIFDKQSRIIAGNDISNARFILQNISFDDTTLIKAGNDFIIRSLSGVTSSESRISHFGPGVLQVQAGGDINLGTSSAGIQLRETFIRPSLPQQAATLILLAGLTKDLGERDAFNFFSALRAAGVAFTEAQAQEDFALAAEISQETRDTVIAEFFSDAELKRGNLLMTNSQIAALEDTNGLYLLVNGFVDVGRSTGSDDGESANTGIYTSLGGPINIYADGNINVNESRVMTFNGGDITMWTERGDINAGRGATTAISESPIRIDEDGDVTFQPPAVGSGVRALNFDPDADGPLVPPEPGDIFLFAAQGVIDAGEAGITGGNLILGATDVVNAQNISFGGVSVGFSSTSAAAPSVGALSGAGTLESTKNLVEETSDLAADKQKDSLSEQLAESSFVTKWIRVEFLGFDKEE